MAAPARREATTEPKRTPAGAVRQRSSAGPGTHAGVTELQRSAGNRALAHQLAQDAGPRATLETGRQAGGFCVQRHASWEHKMLGDVDPSTLEIIASGRDVASEARKKDSWFAKTRNSAQTIRNDKGQAISIATVLHTIDQEITRLQFFRTSPPSGDVATATAAMKKLDADARKAGLTASSDAERVGMEKVIDDSPWDVRLVQVPLSDGSSMLVTYGEINTLADFYGSRAEMAETPADNFRGIVGGVREESLRKFMRLRNELTVGAKAPYNPDSTKHAFAGAIGNKGSAPPKHLKVLSNDQYGELKLMGKVGNEARALAGGREETSYTSGLARNACHFAPQSWHAWAASHTKAETLATESHALTQEAAELDRQSALHALRNNAEDRRTIAQNEQLAATKRAQAASRLNEALIENGFGDHFLQDSYAAGHLINKTLVMQWFTKWLDSQRRKLDYATNANWQKMQQMAYGQDGIAGKNLYSAPVGGSRSNDPQSVENLAGDWTARFDALGLTVPASLRNPASDAFRVFTWWQLQAGRGNFLKTDSKELRRNSPVAGKAEMDAALKVLINDGVVVYNWYSTKDRAKGAEAIGVGTKSLRLKDVYIPKGDLNAFRRSVREAGRGRPDSYLKKAKAASYADYHAFVNNSYLQLSTNVLHDYFCANGLDVATQQGDTPYKIYGDNAMLGKESATMVKYSATTSHQSRDAIYDLAATGQTAHTTAAIAARFPTWVRPKGGAANISLEAWHGDGGSLHRFCNDTIFPDVAAVFSKSTAVIPVGGTISAKVSKDDINAIHSGESF